MERKIDFNKIKSYLMAFTILYKRRIPIIMNTIKPLVQAEGKGLVPFLIEKGYIPYKLPIIFKDVITDSEFDRFTDWWLKHDALNLCLALLQARVIAHNAPGGMWKYKNEVAWVIEAGLIAPRDITFWNVDNTHKVISELTDDELLDVLETNNFADASEREMFLNELIYRGRS